MINDIKSLNIDQSNKNTTKLSDISKETWQYDITKESLIGLVDEHEPDQSNIGTFLLTCLLIFPLIAVRTLSSHFGDTHIAIIGVGCFVSTSMAFILSKAYYHYIRMSILKKRIYKRECDPLRKRPLTLLMKLWMIALFAVIFAITYFFILSPAMSSYMFILLAFTVAIIINYGMQYMNHYRFVMSNAAFVVSYIEKTNKMENEKEG